MTQENAIKFRPAQMSDKDIIWEIIRQSIERRRIDGSAQWQNGYPNEQTIENDISRNFGFVLTVNGEIAVYVALIFNDEPAYSTIDGAWLTTAEFAVIHRVAVSEKFAGKGMVKKLFDVIEDFVKSQNVQSIKVDTNYDNLAMLKILDHKGYTYCGEVFLAGGIRKAFEKVLI